jgi:chromosome segregation ATPase
VLYLAEVKKQTKSFIGGSKTELRLIACQRGDDQSWSVLPQEKLITAEEASQFGDGTLLMINLSDDRQVIGKIDLAADKITSILRTSSRLSTKIKEQEEEIQRWKESLTIQSEELSRREMELATRFEQFEEEGFSDEEEDAYEFGTYLASIVGSPEALREKVNLLLSGFDPLQANLEKHQNQLEQQKKEAQTSQEEVNRQEEELKKQKQQLEKITASIEEIRIALQAGQSILVTKQESLELIKLEQKNIEQLQDKMYRLSIQSGNVDVEHKIDIYALENMPLGELQEVVNRLQSELEKVVRFVNEQEEELTVQCEIIEKLQEKLNMSSEYDRLSLDGELTDEQERKKMLDETLVGQRRSLRERQEILRQHLRILRRRQGMISTEEEEQAINLEPLVQALKDRHSILDGKGLNLESEIQKLQQNFQQLQLTLQQQTEEQQRTIRDLQQQEESWKQAQSVANELQLRIKIYEENVTPLLGSLKEIRQQLEPIEQLVNKVINILEQRQQAIA